MKFRAGFVTNSSSSSYTCERCGNTESGMDLGLSECGMVECTHGHTFCLHCLLKEYDPEAGHEEGDDYYDAYYGIPSEYCPICNLILIPDYLVMNYVKAICTITTDDVFQSVKAQDPSRQCLYDTEYLEVVLHAIDKTRDQIIHEIKQYKTSAALMEFVYQQQKSQK